MGPPGPLSGWGRGKMPQLPPLWAALNVAPVEQLPDNNILH